MIFSDLKKTYKSFLLVLCGALLITVPGGSSGLAVAAGVIILLIFSVKLLNGMIYEPLFDSEGHLVDTGVSFQKMICSKMFLLFCYSLISEIFVLAGLYLTKQYMMLEARMPEPKVFYDTISADSYTLASLGGAALYRSVVWALVGLSLIAIMLVVVGRMKRSCRTAWNVFWVINLLIIPFVVQPCLDFGFSLMMGAVSAEMSAALLMGVVYLAVSFAVLKKMKNQ